MLRDLTVLGICELHLHQVIPAAANTVQLTTKQCIKPHCSWGRYEACITTARWVNPIDHSRTRCCKMLRNVGSIPASLTLALALPLTLIATLQVPKLGYGATAPGSVLKFTVDTSSTTQTGAADPHTVVTLSHMKSYEGMGRAGAF